MGFEEMPTDNYVESSFWNFDSLYQQQQHPARDSHDTFFLREPATTRTLPEDYVQRVKQVHESGGYGSRCYGYEWKREEANKIVLRTLQLPSLQGCSINLHRKWTFMIREQEKDRLTPIIESLSSSYLGPDYSQPKDFTEVSLKDIDQVAKSSFPLCMRHLFEKLREDHHLKHGGRMQFGLFLKVIY